MASVFKPLMFIDNKFTIGIFDPFKGLGNYAENVINRGSFSKTIPSNYEELFKNLIERKKSYLLTMSFSL